MQSLSYISSMTRIGTKTNSKLRPPVTGRAFRSLSDSGRIMTPCAGGRYNFVPKHSCETYSVVRGTPPVHKQARTKFIKPVKRHEASLNRTLSCGSLRSLSLMMWRAYCLVVYPMDYLHQKYRHNVKGFGLIAALGY